MTNHSTIRNRKNKPEEKVYPLVIRKELYQELQSTAYANDISVADFVRRICEEKSCYLQESITCVSKDSSIITYNFDADIKDSITMYQLQKMLKEIKSSMSKHGKIKVIIEKV